MRVDHAREDDRDVGQVKGRGCDVEDCDDRLLRANPDEVEAGATKDNKPYRVYWCVSMRIDLTPEAVQSREMSVTKLIQILKGVLP